MTFFTIVIPTLNEEKFLPNLLSDLTQQSYTEFEVKVVDANSTDKTLSIAQNFANKLRLQLLNSKLKNVSHQRNLGGRTADSPWIIFMDADNRLPTYFFDGLRYQIAKHEQVDLFTTLIDTTEDPADAVIQHLVNLNMAITQLLKRPQALGAMLGCKNELFKKIQFDEKTNYLEDFSFIDKLVKDGYQYQLFRQPKYFYSLRRIKKEGWLNSLRITAQTQIEYLQGKRQFKDHRYPMLGGSYYDKNSKNSVWNNLESLQKILTEASNKQLREARKLLRLIKMDSD